MKKLSFLLLLTTFMLGMKFSAKAQCDDLGLVVETDSCGLRIVSFLTGAYYQPAGSDYGLTPGQLISFSVDTVAGAGGCEPAVFVSLTCLEGFDNNQCVDSTAIDVTQPCTAEYEPVCGCDGITYDNACQAENWYGITSWLPGACPGDALNCEASFMYAYLGDQTFVFYNNSGGFSAYAWDFGSGVVLSQEGQTTLVAFPQDTALVCLAVWNEAGCTDEQCLLVYPGADEEMCQQTDCVWPGDANGDAKANMYDLLNIGLGFDSNGPPRPFYPFPDDPIAWAPNYSDDWDHWIGPVNYKHLDCDGNGWVEEEDIDAISHNYSPDFEYNPSPTPGAPPVYLQFSSETLVIDDNSPQFLELTAQLMVGTNLLPVDDLYGMALQIQYPHDLVAPNTVSADYNDNSFFGEVYQVLTVKEDLYNYNFGRYDLALSRKNGEGSSGYGPVATLSFIVNADIIDGRARPHTPFNVILDGIKLIDAQGDTLGFDLPPDTASVMIIDDTLAGTTDWSGGDSAVAVYPNPAENHLRVRVDDRLQAATVELFDTRGRRVRQLPLRNNEEELRLEGLAPGVYWLRIHTQQGLLTRKVIVQQ